MLGDEEGVSHIRTSTWIRAPKTAFASALTRSGAQMASCTAKPISIGLRPSGKSWRHQRPRSQANRPGKRSDGRLHVLRPPERSRSPANATQHGPASPATHFALGVASGPLRRRRRGTPLFAHELPGSPRCHIAGRPSKRMGGSNGGACRAFRTLALAAIGGGSQNLSCLRQFEGRSRISNCLAQMLAPVRRQSER